jgi:hypothetical protein
MINLKLQEMNLNDKEIVEGKEREIPVSKKMLFRGSWECLLAPSRLTERKRREV